MTNNKAIKVCLSDSEYRRVEDLVSVGVGRTKADFARTAILLHIDKYEANSKAQEAK